MPKISSNLETTKGFTTMEPGWRKGAPVKVNYESKQDKAPALVLDWELRNNEKDNGRRINFDRIIVGGSNDAGEAYSLNRLLMAISALGVAYTCEQCGNDQTSAPVRNKDTNTYHCPGCEAQLLNISYATEDFANKVCWINVDVKPRQKNEIDPNTGKTKLVAVTDEDGKPIKDNVIKGYRSLENPPTGVEG